MLERKRLDVLPPNKGYYWQYFKVTFSQRLMKLVKLSTYVRPCIKERSHVHLLYIRSTFVIIHTFGFKSSSNAMIYFILVHSCRQRAHITCVYPMKGYCVQARTSNYYNAVINLGNMCAKNAQQENAQNAAAIDLIGHFEIPTKYFVNKCNYLSPKELTPCAPGLHDQSSLSVCWAIRFKSNNFIHQHFITLLVA